MSGRDARARLRLAALSLAALLLSPGARAAEPATPAEGAGERGQGEPHGGAAPAEGAGGAARRAGGAAAEASDRATAAPAELEEEVVVTATRTARSRRRSPAAVTVVPRGDVERSPTKTVDELLRTVPSFGLFRRSSSMAADPSSTGVNLRGVGPSAVSRSLVLVDGIPATDPFGGWVYWRAIPRSGVERIEVVPGGGSSLYGNYALGGVTQVLSRPIAPLALDGRAELGPFDTYQLGLRAADRRGPFGAAIEAELLDSRGYPVVAPDARGAIDGDTPSFSAAVTGRAEASVARGLTVALRGGYFHQDQSGGTRFTTAGVKRLAYGAGVRYAPGALGSLELSLFGHASELTQSRARVTVDRADEVQGAFQTVPTDDLGAGLMWTSEELAFLGRHTLTVGADVRWISGEAQEDLFPPGSPPDGGGVVRRDAGGTQWLYGAFVQELWDVSPALELNLAVRYDRWENRDGHQLERTSGAGASLEEFPARSDERVSPKAGLRVSPLEALTLRAAAYGAFRAPTLNELYRPFQVGPIRTLANPNLGPETLRGAEAGLDVAPVRGLLLRATGFWNVLAGPVTNVTIGQDLRQRHNLGEARIRGIEADAGLRFLRVWRAAAAYTFTDSEITDAPGQPQLLGKELPQGARHRASASLAFDEPRLLFASAQVRYVGAQYEDDANALPMSGVYLVDLALSRRWSDHLELFLGVENLLDRRYLVGRAGVDTIGQPRFVHGGVRLRFGG